MVADLNLKELKFEEFFTPDLCIDKNNAYGEFMGNQAGGRMFPFKDNKILFTYGEYRFRDHAQDKNNLFVKVHQKMFIGAMDLKKNTVDFVTRWLKLELLSGSIVKKGQIAF